MERIIRIRCCSVQAAPCWSLPSITGDLNADFLKPDDAETRALLSSVENDSLKIVKHGATHYTRTTTTNSDNLIDVILVDEQDRLLNYDKFPSPYARNGHDVITATFGLF